jgi:hypothetical protein
MKTGDLGPRALAPAFHCHLIEAAMTYFGNKIALRWFRALVRRGDVVETADARSVRAETAVASRARGVGLAARDGFVAGRARGAMRPRSATGSTRACDRDAGVNLRRCLRR